MVFSSFFQFIKLFISTLIVLIGIDFLWVGKVARGLYDSELGSLARRAGGVISPYVPAVFVGYVVFALGIIFFVLPKASGSWVAALGWGALFGLVLYGVYDATNYGVLAGYTLKIAIIDVLWGTFLSAIGSAILVWLWKCIA